MSIENVAPASHDYSAEELFHYLNFVGGSVQVDGLVVTIELTAWADVLDDLQCGNLREISESTLWELLGIAGLDEVIGLVRFRVGPSFDSSFMYTDTASFGVVNAIAHMGGSESDLKVMPKMLYDKIWDECSRLK